MRWIKAFLVGATGLFVFITLLSLLIPASPRVSRTVVINETTTGEVYNQFADLRNWKNWHPVFTTDSATVNFTNITKGKNASCNINYHNKTVHLVITETDTASIRFTLTAKGENDISNMVRFSAVPGSSQVQVDWISTTHLHWYPWEKFYAIFIDKLTGPGYETALNNLKLFIETSK
ncbi:MAG: SRPBCC family protein [Chitinophagaceae bacterium]|nr:SRPBCC family protein [Chitinophagaceae bacterium]